MNHVEAFRIQLTAFLMIWVSKVNRCLTRFWLQHSLSHHLCGIEQSKRSIKQEHNLIAFHERRAQRIERELLYMEFTRLTQKGRQYMQRAEQIKKKFHPRRKVRHEKAKETNSK